jgi:hypothetical protein
MINDITLQYLSQVQDYYETGIMKKNWKRSCWFAALVLSTFFVGYNSVFAQQSTITASENTSSNPVDLTAPVQSETDDKAIAKETEATEETLQTADPAPAVSLSTGGQDSSLIRLAALGINLPPEDSLDRTMWQGSDATMALDLYRRLPAKMAVSPLRQQLARVVLMRSLPPEGSIAVATELVEARLNWLITHVGGEDLAEIVRQLPDSSIWEDWHQWLALHDLMTRNDENACRLAESRAAGTLEIIWHKVNAFCMIIAGDQEKASFALDILKDRGVSSPIYFEAMRQLIIEAPPATIDQTGADALDLVLLDSAHVNITMAAIKPLDRFAFSLSGLHYLEDDAATLIAARYFQQGNRPIADVVATWYLQPVTGIPAPEALTRFSLADEADAIAMARFQMWQALELEKDEVAAAQLALEALKVDFQHVGSRSLGLWMPFIINGQIDAGPLPGLISGLEHDGLTDQAAAWGNILDFSKRPLDDLTIAKAGAIDAIPLMQAIGLRMGNFDRASEFEQSMRLAENTTPLPPAQLELIDAAATAGRHAELVMLSAINLGEVPLHHLSRDDATRLVAAFVAAEMEQTARLMAADILRGWVMDRYFRMTGETDAKSS